MTILNWLSIAAAVVGVVTLMIAAATEMNSPSFSNYQSPYYLEWRRTCRQLWLSSAISFATAVVLYLIDVLVK